MSDDDAAATAAPAAAVSCGELGVRGAGGAASAALPLESAGTLDGTGAGNVDYSASAATFCWSVPAPLSQRRRPSGYFELKDVLGARGRHSHSARARSNNSTLAIEEQTLKHTVVAMVEQQLTSPAFRRRLPRCLTMILLSSCSSGGCYCSWLSPCVFSYVLTCQAQRRSGSSTPMLM